MDKIGVFFGDLFSVLGTLLWAILAFQHNFFISGTLTIDVIYGMLVGIGLMLLGLNLKQTFK